MHNRGIPGIRRNHKQTLNLLILQLAVKLHPLALLMEGVRRKFTAERLQRCLDPQVDKLLLDRGARVEEFLTLGEALVGDGLSRGDERGAACDVSGCGWG